MLLIPEPAASRGNGLDWADRARKVLWYPIKINRLAPPARDGFNADGAPLPPPSSPSSPPSDEDLHDQVKVWMNLWRLDK